jgi:hypothetical protein
LASDVGLFNGGGTEQLVKQAIGAGAVLAYSFIATLIIGKIVDLTIGFRITNDQELAGIDVAIHAECVHTDLTDNSQGSVLGLSEGGINNEKLITAAILKPFRTGEDVKNALQGAQESQV